MILYSFRRCPYAMRARMALRYSQCPVEIREVSLKEKPADMLALSPKGTVPVLSVEGKVLEESLDIMRWALARHDPQDWLLSTDSQAAQQANALIEQYVGRIKETLLTKGTYSIPQLGTFTSDAHGNFHFEQNTFLNNEKNGAVEEPRP